MPLILQGRRGIGMNNIEKIIGLDLSANAAGMVVLDRKGKVERIGYITTNKNFTLQGDQSIYYFEAKQTKTKKHAAEYTDCFISRRRNFSFSSVTNFIRKFGTTNTTLVCLEDYAVGSMSPGLLEMAEISGLVRNYLWENGYNLRLHDPMSVKMWAANNGHAKKVHMVDAARQKGFLINDVLLAKGPAFKDPIQVNGRIVTHDYIGPGTDIADAFHLASIGVQELDILDDATLLDRLPENNVKIFTRVTKSNPVRLLDCPFISTWYYDRQKNEKEEQI
jgi:hypothetical protein